MSELEETLCMKKVFFLFFFFLSERKGKYKKKKILKGLKGRPNKKKLKTF